MIFGALSGVPDVVIPAKFYISRLTGFWGTAPLKVAFAMLIERSLQQFYTAVQIVITRNSSGDEIANVNFLYDDIEHVLQNTIDSCIPPQIDAAVMCGTHVYQIQ